MRNPPDQNEPKSHPARKRSRRFYAPEQFEMPFDGGFRLISESTIDGQRIADEKAAIERAARHAARLQTELF